MVNGKAFSILFSSLILAAPLVSAAPGDWPSFRHDPQLTGISPLKGAFKSAPREIWSIDLGAKDKKQERVRVADVDGDGLDEILLTRDNRIICLGRDGAQRWEVTDLPNAKITDVRNLAGSGARGILAWSDSGLESHRWVIAGDTGKAVKLYTMSDVFGAEERLGAILPGVPGEQLCAWWSGDHPGAQFGGNMRGEGFLFSFEKGVEQPVTRFDQRMEGMLFKPKHFFADYDEDGHAEMVMVSHQQAWFFDIEHNSLKLKIEWPMIRTYNAVLAVLPFERDGAPSLFSINPHIPGVERVDIAGGAARVAWRYVAGGVEDQYQTRVKIAAGAPDPFLDLGGDGHRYVLAAVANEHNDGKTWLVVLDGADGAKRFEEAGLSVLGLDDLDGDGRPEVLLKQGEALRIAQWQNDAFADRWRADGVEPLFTPMPAAGDLGRSEGGNRTIWRLSPDNGAFLLRFSDGVYACTLGPGGVERGELVTVHPAMGNVPEPNPPAETVNKEEDAVVVKKGDAEIYRYTIARAPTYLAPPAIVAELGGQRRILVRDASDHLVSFDTAGGDRRELAVRVFGEWSVCDMDGDGNNEIVAGVLDASEKPECIFIDGNGQVLRRFGLIENATSIKVGPTGALGPDQGRWLALYFERGVGDRNGVVVYDGKTGEQRWLRDDFRTEHGAYAEGAKVKFVLHIPTAVYDYDGDGADDLLAASENFYGIVDVAHNRDLTPLQVFSDYIPGHWQAYASPIAADFLGRGRPQVFHHKAFANTILTDLEGKPIWHWGLSRSTTASAWPGIADLNGDGTLEIVQSRVDGRLRGFSAEPSDKVCPQCPKDGPLTEMNHAATVRWEHVFAAPISDLASGDLDGDGQGEVIFGTGDGTLYQLGESNGAPVIEWSLPLGRTAGSPILADLDGDGSPEVLVPVLDGTLRCLVPGG